MQSDKPAAPDRSVLEAMVAFIKANLVKQASLSNGAPFLALAETAVRFNDTSWFWTDDNAKAAELLVEPGFYDADPGTANAAMDFVLRMSEGAVIQRRCGPAELRVISTDPAAFRVETAFFIIEGDLTAGVVRHSLRFNDGRTVIAAQHTGNVFSCRHKGRPLTVDVENAVSSHGITVQGRTAVFTHTSTLRKPRKGWNRGPEVVLGQLTYTYTVSADRPTVALEVTFAPAPGETLEQVILTTAYDQLYFVPGVDYRALGIRAGGKNVALRGIGDKQTDLHAGPAESTCIAQEGASPGFSYAIHTLMPDGDKLSAIVARGQKHGKLHWVLHRYAMGAVTAAHPVTLREERMLTGGGYYDALEHYATVMRTGAGGGDADPSMTYDIGAELNAIAAHILFARTGQYATPPDAARLDALTTWFDRHVTRYFDFIRPDEPDALDRVFTRGIGYVVCALDCMVRATADERYRTLMNTGTALILRMLRREIMGRDTYGGTFGDTWAGLVPFLDNHSACILALARAAWHGTPPGTEPGALGRAAHEGVLGIRLYTGTVDLGNNGHTEAYDGIAVLNLPERGVHADTGFWNFKTGVTLRALHALEDAGDAGVVPMSEVDRRRIRRRIDLGQDLLTASYRWHGDMLEVLTSVISGETNSETQPWIALGLVPVVDRRIVQLGTRGS